MPKKSITKLYAEFEKALAALGAFPRARNVADEKKVETEYEAALDLCSDLCDRIVKTRANPEDPIPEMLLKIAAAGWGVGVPGPLDEWGTDAADARQGEELSCLVSLRADLQAMQGAPPRRARRTDTRRRVGDQVVRS